MRRTSGKTPLFTPGERKVAGLAILTAVVLTLSAQVVESMMRPSLGLYDTMLATPTVGIVDAQR